MFQTINQLYLGLFQSHWGSSDLDAWSVENWNYPLVMTNIAIENGHRNS